LYFTFVIESVGIPQCVAHSLYSSSTRGPEDDSVESKHIALLSHYMFNITTVFKFYSHQLMHFFIQLCISLLSYIKIT